MDTIGLPDPDSPEQADRTMQRLELVATMDEWFPRWRSMVGECEREGVLLGWVAGGTGPAGTLLNEIGDDGRGPEAAPLTWDARQLYLLLRAPEAPEHWVRAIPWYSHPVTYRVDAVLLTREIEPEHGIRCWQLLDADNEPVMVTDSAAGGGQRPWLLRADASYDLEYDVEGWKAFAHHVPEGTIARPDTSGG